MATGYVIASAPDEQAAVDGYWDGNNFQAVVNASDFFVDVRIDEAREDMATLQARFNDVDVRLVAANRTIAIGTDNDTAQGFIIGSSPTQGGAIDNYWNDDTFQPLLDDAEFFSKAAGQTIDEVRLEESTLQKRNLDVEIRVLPADASVTV
ncbi:MAG: hypothetical protein F6K65_34850 [Moorea sp. SIO3C2]|nr:hypothetical protein [Moorena sp. SIO3C2]